MILIKLKVALAPKGHSILLLNLLYWVHGVWNLVQVGLALEALVTTEPHGPQNLTQMSKNKGNIDVVSQ